MALSTEQVYYSTLSAYQNIMEQFNPGLQNLVLLGSNFVRAFQTLTGAANAYFAAVAKFGEQALKTSSSQTLGQVLLQMADTQRELSNDLEIIFRRFNNELLREMEQNTKLDMDYITKSKYQFEKEHRSRSQMLKEANTDLQRVERMRSPYTRDVQEKFHSLETGMQSFLQNSYKLVVAEERRRYRFLVEKHFHLSCNFLSFYTKARDSLHNKIPVWSEHSSAASQGNTSSRASPRISTVPLNMNDASNFNSISKRSFISSPQPLRKWSELNGELSLFPNPELSKPGERSPSMRLNSIGGLSNCGPQGTKVNAMTGTTVRAVISHSAAGNQSLLSFEKGDIILILVPESKNGWLFGKLEGTSKQGWFPLSFVQPFQGEIRSHETTLRPFPLRSSRSAENLLEPREQYMLPRVDYSSLAASKVPAPPPLPYDTSRSQSPAPPNQRSRRNSTVSLAVSEGGQSRIFGGPYNQPEIFPRGTNPFATVKLKPTVTNDRSMPLIR
ncbi:brain-specific angiogenesis inhibitor 1-associated protein 2-like protein 2 isoform X1 [Hypanus sabinus]|uniref:brain-specific angiogenesis inhibitor 1-associated protein 2-like protein 2 isoform X1 n=1 Tax=Hypanus sabinus TaxID=79690 RepID=UPI0028C43A9D|nr:brain-specific angiogenesis inhibitor 1-associated protein 2-like protein 2 isoform X1 [Hypanus sabinus]